MKKPASIIIILLILLVVAILTATGHGALFISLNGMVNIIFNKIGLAGDVKFTDQQENVFLYIRLPRVILCALIGIGLSISGTTMQALFNNPMAEPGIIGTSAGASLFTAIFIVLFQSFSFDSSFANYALAIVAFTGAVVATFLVYKIAALRNSVNKSTLLLAGIAVNAIAMAFVGLCIYLSDDDKLRTITFWSLGSMGSATWNIVLIMIPLIVIPSIILYKKYFKILNIWSLGEQDSFFTGIDIKRSRKVIILLTSVITGVCVAFTGIIGFIGLITPHIFRLLSGPDHKFLIPGAAILGAIILISSDLISRTIVAPAELPVGIVTTCIGAPYFLYLVIRNNKAIQL